MAKKDKTKTTPESQSLKCVLTEKELLQCGDELATALDNLRQLGEEKDAVSKQFKAKETSIDAEITTKQLLVRNKYQYRRTPCELTINYTTQTATVARLDTGEVVVDRPLAESEKQMEIDFDSPKKPE